MTQDHSPKPIDDLPGAELYERELVLVALRAQLPTLRKGQGKMVSLSGEAGIGKTSVLRAFAQMASEECLIVQGGCEDLMTSRPLGPIFDMADLLDPDLLGHFSDGRDHSFLFNHLLITIQRSSTPIVMIIEDIHWADDATLDLIKFLGRRVATLPLLLLISHRDDETARRYPIGRLLGSVAPQDLVRITLTPLSAIAVDEMARVAGRDAGDIYRITNGNPFFVSEILASGADKAIPTSVRDAVWARLEDLSGGQRDALEALSIIPGGATQELLLSLVPDLLAIQFDALFDAGILIRDGQLIRFRHELARQAVFVLLSENRKRRLHVAAEAWFALQEDIGDLSILAQRMHHANAAGDHGVILALAQDVSARAAKIGAHKQAAQFLSLALPHIDRLPPAEAAQFLENWSYESGLAEQIDEYVIKARHRAIALWQKVGCIEKIGLNYRWLSRLHWYRGEAEHAKRYIDMAIDVLQTVNAGPELAWSYSVRSQWAMLNDQFEDAIVWGERAKVLAYQFNETEIYVHVLNNIATSLLLSTDPVRGRAMMDESLVLSLEHNLDEQAARVYTNMSEYALAARDLDLAEDYLEKGIAFDTEHDLDSWLHYLRGCRARYLMMRGDLEAAANLARDVLAIPNQTAVMQLPAASVLAQINARLGRADARQELLDVLACALSTEEPQRIAPIRIALAELAWLSGDLRQVQDQVHSTLSANHAKHPWDIGLLHCWAFRAGEKILALADTTPEPIRLECMGQTQDAADAYGRMGMPFEQALVISTIGDSSPPTTLEKVNVIFQSLTAPNKGKLVIRRGQYAAARAHPAGLTIKEQQVLYLLCRGASNALIASTLNRSIRTVEHHVAAICGKLEVKSRNGAVSRALSEPQILTGVTNDFLTERQLAAL